MLKPYYCKIHVSQFDASPMQIKQYHLEPKVGDQSYQLNMAPASMASVRKGMLLATTTTGNIFALTEKRLRMLFNQVADDQYICLVRAEKITDTRIASS